MQLDSDRYNGLQPREAASRASSMETGLCSALCSVSVPTNYNPSMRPSSCAAATQSNTHMHHQTAAAVLHDVARVDGQRRHAEDGEARAVGRKVHERAKGVPRSPVVHAGHRGAQVRKLRLLHLHSGKAVARSQPAKRDRPSMSCWSTPNQTQHPDAGTAAAKRSLQMEPTHQVAHCDRRRGQVVLLGGVVHAARQRRAPQTRGFDGTAAATIPAAPRCSCRGL